MWDLRWVLVGLGALLIVGIFIASMFRRRAGETGRAVRHEPLIDAPPSAPRHDGSANDEALPLQVDRDADPGPSSGSHASQDPHPPGKEPRKPASNAVDRVIALRLVPKTGNEIPAESAVLALRALDLRHGRYGIFHRLNDDGEECYSVASLTEPGSFDLTNLSGSAIAGLSVFMVLPGPGEQVERFDAMIATARELAQRLAADLLDERGSSWSIQRERYIREEIIDYRHQLDHV